MNQSALTARTLDVAYQPFPLFDDWRKSVTVSTERWDRYLSQLRSSERSPETLARARSIVTRAAAIDTGAIEGLYEVDRGFTFTVAFETAAWEAALSGKGEQVKSLFESQLHAYDFVLNLATGRDPVSEAAIRNLHAVICAAQETYRVETPQGPQEQSLPRGRYKAMPNHVRTRTGEYHSYAPVDVTPDEVFRLVREMQSEAFQNAHPVLQASYVHYAFVVIHPFADGNGRVARALASVFSYRAISAPIVILSEQKDAYLVSLGQADAGRFQAFVDFMLARSLETIQMVTETLLSESSFDLDSGFSRLRDLYQTSGGYSQDAVDDAGKRLLDVVVEEFGKIFDKYRSNKFQLTVNRSIGGTAPAPGAAFRHLSGEFQSYALNLQTAAPANAYLQRQFYVLVPRDAGGQDDVRVVGLNWAIDFTAQIDHLIPRITSPVLIRVQLFADRIIGMLVSELIDKANRTLHGESS